MSVSMHYGDHGRTPFITVNSIENHGLLLIQWRHVESVSTAIQYRD